MPAHPCPSVFRQRYFPALLNGFFVAVTAIAFSVVGIGASWSQESPKGLPKLPKWSHGPPQSEEYFPIAVWLQNPRNAAKFKEAGINLYVGLWNGPNEEQLATLAKARMPVICDQNAFALQEKDNPIIVGWMHGDEPDNAQSLGRGRGYGPPILPEKIVRDYERIRASDPTRPVLLNLGQGVAWDNYIGRGVRRNHPEDYPEYIKGCDIASFDIYPAVHKSPEVAGKLEFVARGVERLVTWGGGDKAVWNCIECTHIGNANVKPTPDQVRSEVWMALICGSRGLIYFVHQFEPTFREAALLDDPEMLAAVTAINREIRELAPVLNRPSVMGGVEVESSTEGAPIAWMLKRNAETMHLFAVNLGSVATEAAFTISEAPDGAKVEVIGESRTVPLKDGRLDDSFKPYEVHLYKLEVLKP
ncbi:MAG: hypothetical protein ACI9R3_005966 [Verrucomicrobiales bacterium]